MPKENEFTKDGVNPLCQNTGLWSARDLDGSEMEVGEFLYGLIRLIKPRIVVETGCYLGDATEAIARALKDNNYGSLFSCDIKPEYVESVENRLREKGLNGLIFPLPGEEMIEQAGTIDFAFIDSGGASREREIEKLIPRLKPMGMFCLHDTAPQHSQIREITDKVNLPKVYFNTPRGLTLFQKR